MPIWAVATGLASESAPLGAMRLAARMRSSSEMVSGSSRVTAGSLEVRSTVDKYRSEYGLVAVAAVSVCLRS